MVAILNYFDNPKIYDQIYVKKGDVIYGNKNGLEFHITESKPYMILDVNDVTLLTVQNDIGQEYIYSVEYFVNYSE
jgi:hypothetical protein